MPDKFCVPHTVDFTLLDIFVSCILELCSGVVKLFGGSLILSGFALLGRLEQCSALDYLFSTPEARSFCILHSVPHDSGLAGGRGVCSLWAQGTPDLFWSLSLSLEQFPTHMLWSDSEEYLKGSLWRAPGFSLCAALYFLVLCPMNCSHLGLPGCFALSPWLSLQSSAWVSSPCTEAWNSIRAVSWAIIGLISLFLISLWSLLS